MEKRVTFFVFCGLDEEHRLRKVGEKDKDHFSLLIFKMNHNSSFNLFLKALICNNKMFMPLFWTFAIFATTLFFFYLFFLLREREREGEKELVGRGKGRGRERILSRLQIQCWAQLRASSQDRSWDDDLSRNQDPHATTLLKCGFKNQIFKSGDVLTTSRYKEL